MGKKVESIETYDYKGNTYTFKPPVSVRTAEHTHSITFYEVLAHATLRDSDPLEDADLQAERVRTAADSIASTVAVLEMSAEQLVVVDADYIASSLTTLVNNDRPEEKLTITAAPIAQESKTPAN